MPSARRRAGWAGPLTVFRTWTVPLLEPVEAERGADHLGAAGAHQSGDAEDLTRAKPERGGAGLGTAGQLAKLEDRFTDGVGDPRINVLDIAADHEPDDLGELRLRHPPAANGGAVAQDRVAIADALAFLEKMADVDDAHALLFEPADGSEQVLGVHSRQAARRFVHDQHLRLADQRPGDLDDLLLGDGAGVNRGLERDGVVLQLGECLAGQGPALAAVDPAVASRFFAQQDVLLDAEVRCQVEFLVDHRDPASTRVQRVRRPEGRALEFDVARVRHIGPAENLHQRALAGAIFADQRVDFARPDLQRDILERTRGAEALAHFDHA